LIQILIQFDLGLVSERFKLVNCLFEIFIKALVHESYLLGNQRLCCMFFIQLKKIDSESFAHETAGGAKKSWIMRVICS